MSTQNERTVVAQAILAHVDAVDIEYVQEHWDDYGPARQKALSDAGAFIALHDALMKAREGKA